MRNLRFFVTPAGSGYSIVDGNVGDVMTIRPWFSYRGDAIRNCDRLNGVSADRATAAYRKTIRTVNA